MRQKEQGVDSSIAGRTGTVSTMYRSVLLEMRKFGMLQTRQTLADFDNFLVDEIFRSLNNDLNFPPIYYIRRVNRTSTNALHHVAAR